MRTSVYTYRPDSTIARRLLRVRRSDGGFVLGFHPGNRKRRIVYYCGSALDLGSRIASLCSGFAGLNKDQIMLTLGLWLAKTERRINETDLRHPAAISTRKGEMGNPETLREMERT